MQNTTLQQLLKRDRLPIMLGLVILLAWSWWYTIDMAKMANANCPMLAKSAKAWTPSYFFMMLEMWVVMMMAMMLPSVTPMILMFASVHHKRRQQQKPFVSTGFFLAGYLIAWAGFSAVATILQWWLQNLSLLSPAMSSTNTILGGVILLCAGLFQFTSLKRTCLLHCSNPLDFIITNWREGKGGALIMGLHHGSFCIGCCWLLMALLFVVGVMNIAWVILLSIFVLLEKLLKNNNWLRYIAGGFFILWSIITMGMFKYF